MGPNCICLEASKITCNHASSVPLEVLLGAFLNLKYHPSHIFGIVSKDVDQFFVFYHNFLLFEFAGDGRHKVLPHVGQVFLCEFRFEFKNVH